jgi:hypothetical protein
LAGEHGTGKSTAGRIIRSLIDPSEAPLRSPPREDRELVVAARNSHVIGLDNLSYLSGWLSDALCRIATGGGYSARELYTDGGEVVFSDCRPIIMTSIEDVASRADLADRTIPIQLPRISERSRRPERVILEAIDELRPYLLGGLLEAVSTSLHMLPPMGSCRGKCVAVATGNLHRGIRGGPGEHRRGVNRSRSCRGRVA